MLSFGSEEDASPEGGLWRAVLPHCHHSCGRLWDIWSLRLVISHSFEKKAQLTVLTEANIVAS